MKSKTPHVVFYEPRIFRLAFTRIELLTISLILIVMVLVLGSQLARAREKQRRTQCVNNLKNVGVAFRILTGDGDRFPFEHSTNNGGTREMTYAFEHYRVLSNEMSKTEILVCPATGKKPSSAWETLQDANVSYFVGLSSAETYPESFLAGDSDFLISGKSPLTNRIEITQNTEITFPLSLHGAIENAAVGNIAFADSSVFQLSAARIKDYQRASSRGSLATNLVLLPR